jgi:hypothetical protein
MAWIVIGAVAAAAVVLGALCVSYRYALLRGLRDRHPSLWDELGRPAPLGPPTPRSGRRLGAFLRSGRYYTVNDADLAAAARLYVVTRRVLGALFVAGVAFAVLCAGR